MLRPIEQDLYAGTERRDLKICTGSPPASKATPGNATHAPKPINKALIMMLCADVIIENQRHRKQHEK